MDINTKGDLAVAKVCLRAIEKGVAVSRPISDSTRYDLIVDEGGKLLRAQVKYAGVAKTKIVNGVARVSLEKNYYRKSGCKSLFYNKDEVDIVLAYIPAIDQVCCFGPEFFENKNNIYIRFEPAKNKQKKCVFADDHLW